MDDFWRIVSPFIPENLRDQALKELKNNKLIQLPGFGVAEIRSRKITSSDGKDYFLTPAQVQVIINIASSYPKLCNHRGALRELRSYYGEVDRDYLRVILSKIKTLCPSVRRHIVNEKSVGYRWVYDKK